MDPTSRRQIVSRGTTARVALHLNRALLQARLADARESRENAAALRNQAQQIRSHHSRSACTGSRAAPKPGT
jgi:hypothetical protein